MAHHLQDLVWRIVPVENANFLSLSPEHKELEACWRVTRLRA